MKLPTESWAQYHIRTIDDYRKAWKRKSWRENEEAAQKRREEYGKDSVDKQED